MLSSYPAEHWQTPKVQLLLKQYFCHSCVVIFFFNKRKMHSYKESAVIICNLNGFSSHLVIVRALGYFCLFYFQPLAVQNCPPISWFKQKPHFSKRFLSDKILVEFVNMSSYLQNYADLLLFKNFLALVQKN